MAEEQQEESQNIAILVRNLTPRRSDIEGSKARAWGRVRISRGSRFAAAAFRSDERISASRARHFGFDRAMSFDCGALAGLPVNDELAARTFARGQFSLFAQPFDASARPAPVNPPRLYHADLGLKFCNFTSSDRSNVERRMKHRLHPRSWHMD